MFSQILWLARQFTQKQLQRYVDVDVGQLDLAQPVTIPSNFAC